LPGDHTKIVGLTIENVMIVGKELHTRVTAVFVSAPILPTTRRRCQPVWNTRTRRQLSEMDGGELQLLMENLIRGTKTEDPGMFQASVPSHIARAAGRLQK